MYAAGDPRRFLQAGGTRAERATLTARMIDRLLNTGPPLWPKGFRNEVQAICTVPAADLITPHDILCINGASAALMISHLPFLGPIGAVRVGRIEGRLVINPSLEDLEESDARPHRRRHEGRADDGRGGRGRDPGGHDPGGARARARGDQEGSARRSRTCASRPASRSGSTSSSRPRLEEPRRRGSRRDRRARPPRSGLGRRRARRRARAAVSPCRPPRTTSSRRTQIRAAFSAIFEKLRLQAVEGPLAGAVPRRPEGADGRGAGHEGAQVRESATCSTSGSSRRSSCRSRSARRRPRASPR